MKLHRRQFIGVTLAGISGLLLGQGNERTDSIQPKPFDPYEKVQLGKTGLKMTKVGLGTGINASRRESAHTRMGQEAFTKVARGCLDRGMNWFDTADLYGSHGLLRNALAGVPRDTYLLVSKIWLRPGGIPEPQDQRPDADKVVERFLKELGTDCIDLVLLHCLVESDWNSRYEKQMSLLTDLKQKGVIRAHGVSCHSLEAFKRAAEEPWVDSIHERVNPYGVQMDDTPEKVVPVFEKAHDNGKGTVGMKIMGAGNFSDSDMKRDHSIEYAFNLPCLNVMTVGFESLTQVDDFESRVKKAVRRPVAIS